MTTYPIRSLAAEIASMMSSLLLITFVFVGVILPALNGNAPQAEHSGRIVGGSLFMAMFLAFGIISLRGTR